MKKLIAKVFDGNGPLFFFLAMMLCLVATINISIAFFGTISPSQLTVQETFNFALTGAVFLAALATMFWVGTKTTNKKTVKNEWLVLSPLISMAFLGVFLGFFAAFFAIQTMEGVFGKEAGQAIFYRFLTISSICIILFGFVGLAANLFLVKAFKKRTSKKSVCQLWTKTKPSIQIQRRKKRW